MAHPIFSPPERPPAQILDEIIEVVHAASTMGYAWVSAPQHWLAYPKEKGSNPPLWPPRSLLF